MVSPVDPGVRQPTEERRHAGALVAIYVALVLYGSLYPFAEWRWPQSLSGFLVPTESLRLGRADLLTNVLAYAPLGFLLARWRTGRGAGSMAGATACGLGLSVLVEFAQQWLPSRVASPVDIVANTLGGFAGAWLAFRMRPGTRLVARLSTERNDWFMSGRLADVALVALGLWAAAQLSPFVPSIDIGNLRHSVSDLWQTLQHPATFAWGRWAEYTLGVAGLALLAVTASRRERPVLAPFFAFVALVLLLKIPVYTRELSAEAIAGALAAAGLAYPLRNVRTRTAARVAGVLIIAGLCVAGLVTTPGAATQPFNWVPLREQLDNPLKGIGSILDMLWIGAALGYLARVRHGPGAASRVAIVGGVMIGVLVAALEWVQQYLPGRYPDITSVPIVLAAWTFAMRARADAVPDAPRPKRSRRCRRSQRWRVVFVLGIAAVTALVGVLAGSDPPRERSASSRGDELPAASTLPPAILPQFVTAHPRLPAPGADDLAVLAAQSPQYLAQVKRRAREGSGDLAASLVQAMVDPGSVDLAVLHGRLVKLRPAGRGHEQAKPLAQAYDWLYAQWSAEERAQLRDKLIDACNYVVGRIRAEQLSPYNVYLYNAPLQALTACSIAAYRDDPRADALMNFAYDLWQRRVLPVWRQVMGRHGGWHEGGEYVGIGVGQAVFAVPNMWRTATGEDVLATEPGIAGFVDFVVHSMRPDGTHYRWGDGSRFDREVPDALALAAATNRGGLLPPRPGVPSEPVPTSWPWGPLADPTRVDPAAVAALPWFTVFDGIGMLVARSDWTPDATYVAFKAGDNFWSHSHLDQGAFTIYKGGALAIDSGLYGPYGTDHHMNYAYQTVAHNSVTVTDPEDGIGLAVKGKTRFIANDGGQRRIGSGWGLDAAPVDRERWEAKRRTYHTGSLDRVVAGDDLVVAVSDVTAAYTNARSGTGTFADRTRRVERFWRIFGYDRADDVVVVFDQVRATDPSFRKRWLLHTLEAPKAEGTTFSVSVSAEDRTGHAGGRLEGIVLLPKAADINVIGGRGFEFFADDTNHDEGGALPERAGRLRSGGAEPGAWRIEVQPATLQADDLFLVVVLPTLGNARPTHRVHLIEDARRVGCEIAGPTRTTRWWFEPGRNGVDVEIVTGGQSETVRAQAESAPPPPAPGFLERARAYFAPARRGPPTR